jgi:putative oxidoreductase
LIGKLLETRNDWALTLIRVVAGGVMLTHGAQKMLGWFGGLGFSRTMQVFSHGRGIPPVFVFLMICAEFFGALGMFLGCLSRIAAFSVFVDMVVAASLVNIHFGFFANWNGSQKGEGIEYHLLMIGMALAIMIRGGGAFSVDRLLVPRKPHGSVREAQAEC